MSTDTVKALQAIEVTRTRVARSLDAIVGNFKPGAKVVALVWFDSHPDGSRDFVLGDEPIEEAIRRLQIRAGAGVQIPADIATNPAHVELRGELGELTEVLQRRERPKGPHTVHLSVDIRGALMHWNPDEWVGCVTNDEGRTLTPSEVKADFLDALLRGERYVSCAPAGECPDFDPREHRCPGHPKPPSKEEA